MSTIPGAPQTSPGFISLLKNSSSNNPPSYNSPLGNNSLFDQKPIILENTEDILTQSPDIIPQADNTAWLVDFEQFGTEKALNEYYAGSKIAQRANPKGKPFFILCCYSTESSETEKKVLIIRFSDQLGNILANYRSTFEFDEVLALATKSILDIAAARKDFSFSYNDVEYAFTDAIPFTAEQLFNHDRSISSAQKKLYEDNYSRLLKMAANTDNETLLAIRSLCAVLARLKTDVLKTYNNQTTVLKATDALQTSDKKLTASDIRSMERALLKTKRVVGKFQSASFKSSDDLLDFVNKNLLDQSGNGEATKYVMAYPFMDLLLAKRIELISLLADGSKLGFSGFFSAVAHEMFGTNQLTKGDIIFSLLVTSKEQERQSLVSTLNKDKKIFDLMEYSNDDGFLLEIVSFIRNVVTVQGNKDKESRISTYINCIEQQNFFFFDDAINKNQDAALDNDKKQISLINKGHELTPHYPGRAQTMAKSLAGEDIFKQDSSQGDKDEAAYMRSQVSAKTLFDPLDIIAFTAESKITSGLLAADEDDTFLLPACMVYVLLTKLETAKKWKLIFVSVSVVGLALGVAPLVVAIEAASALGVLITATDVAVDVSFIAANHPDMEEQQPEMAKALNTFAFFYGLARLATSLKDVKGSLSNANKSLQAAIKVLKASGKVLLTGSGGELKFLKILSRNMFKQEEAMSCAAACIRQFAKDRKITLTEAEVRELAKTSKTGTSHDGIKAAMKAVFKDKNLHAGCAGHSVLTAEEMALVLSNSDSWIAIVKPTNGIRHTVIVDKIVGKQVYIRDPWPLEEFSKGMNGVEGIVKLDDFITAWEHGEKFFARIH